MRPFRRRPMLVHAHMVDVARARAGGERGPLLLRDAAFWGDAVRERIERELGAIDVLELSDARVLTVFVETEGVVVWSADRVTIPGEIPLTMLAALTGRILGEVVGGLPDGTHHLRIVGAEVGFGATTFTLDAPIIPARRIPVPFSNRLGAPLRGIGRLLAGLAERDRPRRRDGLPRP